MGSEFEKAKDEIRSLIDESKEFLRKIHSNEIKVNDLIPIYLNSAIEYSNKALGFAENTLERDDNYSDDKFIACVPRIRNILRDLMYIEKDETGRRSITDLYDSYTRILSRMSIADDELRESISQRLMSHYGTTQLYLPNVVSNGQYSIETVK